jgi:protein-tyrosine-phosphatase
VKVAGEDVSILREGAISARRIDEPQWCSVLFVCTGNTDRSPLAAALLRRHLADTLGCQESELESRGYFIASSGLAADPGRRASRRIRQVAREEFDPPLDLEGHAARKLNQEMVEQATRVICMERFQREEILAFFPHRVREVFLLDPEGSDIDDPAGQNLDTYRRLARRLNAAATLIAGSLVP